MHASLAKEKNVAMKNFKRREKEIDGIMLNLSYIAGSINGIEGQNIAEFADFEEIEEAALALLE